MAEISPQECNKSESFPKSRSLPFGANNMEVTQRLIKFLDSTGYDLIQANGQRRYGPPPDWSGPPPSRGCEIFIGKLPRDCFEDEIIPPFERVGKIYEMRLMMDFNGYNRGYGFIKYCKPEIAHRAVLLMDDYEIRPRKKIGVSKSVDNCRLFVGNINMHKTADDVVDELSNFVEGISQVIMYPSLIDKTKNRGFVFVEFETHRLAAMARRILKAGGVVLWGQQIIVDWAEPEPEVDPKIMNKIRKLYIRNLDSRTTEEYLRKVVESFTSPSNILRVKKLKDYAFIHFKTRDSAEYVLSRMEGVILDGQKLEITWARPPMYSKTRIALPNKMSLCVSLPPRLRNMYRVPRIPIPNFNPVLTTAPHYCVPQPIIISPCTPASQKDRNLSSSSTGNSSDPVSYEHIQHSNVITSTPCPNMSHPIGSASSGSPQQHVPNQLFRINEQMQNILISQAPTATTIDHTVLTMPFSSHNIHMQPPTIPLYYPYFDRTQAIH